MLFRSTEQDPTASLTGRCFGALVAKKLAVDVDVNLTHSSDVVRGAKLDYFNYSRPGIHEHEGGGTSWPSGRYRSREHRLAYIGRDGRLGHRKGTIGSTGHIPKDCRHSHRGLPGFTECRLPHFNECRTATRSPSHFPRDTFKRAAITSSCLVDGPAGADIKEVIRAPWRATG